MNKHEINEMMKKTPGKVLKSESSADSWVVAVCLVVGVVVLYLF